MTDGAQPFSEIGDRYHAELARGLRSTGESADYFARKRIERMRDIVREQQGTADVVLDFGCGPGTSFALLREAFPRARIIGFEPAQGLHVLAARAGAAVGAELHDGVSLANAPHVDVVYCNGVFHHIALDERAPAMASIAQVLRPGGRAFVWENSPFNPGTRYVMSQISFDRGAQLLSPRALRALQTGAGLEHVQTEFHFVFPHALRAFRSLEAVVRALPFGGQYLVVGTRRAAQETR